MTRGNDNGKMVKNKRDDAGRVFYHNGNGGNSPNKLCLVGALVDLSAPDGIRYPGSSAHMAWYE